MSAELTIDVTAIAAWVGGSALACLIGLYKATREIQKLESAAKVSEAKFSTLEAALKEQTEAHRKTADTLADVEKRLTKLSTHPSVRFWPVDKDGNVVGGF